MKKTISSLVVGAVLLGSTAFGVEMTFTDTDSPNVYLNKDSDHAKQYDGVFDITPGFNPATMTVLSATVSFDMRDDGDDASERVRIKLDDVTVVPSSDSNVKDYDFTYVLGGGEVAGKIITDIKTDGKISYIITATKGDFYYEGGTLEVVADVPGGGNNAPDGGTTMLLLGSALAGLGFLRRKF